MERDACHECHTPVTDKTDLPIRFGEDVEHWHPACLDRWLLAVNLRAAAIPAYETRRMALAYYRDKREAEGKARHA